MKRLWHYSNILILLSLIIGLLLIYREVIFNGKILFPSNFLAQFYSPWRTEKFSGWEVGIPHKPIGDDQIRIFYPERAFINTMLTKNTIPLWNPYTFAGTPFLANFQSAIFYPLNILYFFLPQIYTWEFLLFIQPIMAAFFMYLFLNLFKLKKGALWLGAISFGFSGFMIVWSQENVVVGQAALWLPLTLFGIEGYLTHKKLWYYCVAVIALACSVFGGFIQITFYVFVFSFLYGLFRVKTLQLPFFGYALKMIGIYILSLGLSAVQLIPSIEAFLESPRSTSSAWYLFEGYLLPITHMFNAFVPDIFGNPGAYNFFGRGFYRETILYAGLVPFVFAIYASFRAKANSVVLFFIGAAFFSFFLTLDSPFTKWLFQLPLPLLPTFLPSRILVLTTFSISALSAFGLSMLIEYRENKNRRLMLSILSAFYISILLIAIYGLLLLNYSHIPFFQHLNDYIIRHGSFPTKMNILVLLKNLILPFLMLSFLFILLRTKKMHNLSFVGIIILTLFGQFYFLNKYIVIGDPQFLYPKNAVVSFLQSRNSQHRFLTFRQPMEENISTYARIYSVEGTNPVFPRRYGELLFALKNNGKIAIDIPRVEARLSELGDKENPFEDKKRVRLFSLLGIKHVLYFDDHNPKNSGANKYPENLFKPIWQHNNWYGLEYLNSFPRAFLASNIYIEDNPQEILNLLFDPKVDLLSTIILEEKPRQLNSSKSYFKTLLLRHSGKPKAHPESPSGIRDSGQARMTDFEMNTSAFVNLPKPSTDSFASVASYEPQKIVIHTKTNVPQILFLPDNYYPGWKAYVDNKETKIYRANYTFRSIYLPKGTYEVTFKYDPMSFKIGLAISVLSVIILLLFIVKNFKNSNFWVLKDSVSKLRRFCSQLAIKR